MKATYYIEGTEVNYSDCLEYFILYSGFSRDDAIAEFKDNDNPDCCGYISQECQEVEIIYQ